LVLLEEPNNIQPDYNKRSNLVSLPMVAGFLLIVAGVISIIIWTGIYTVDEANISQFANIEDFRSIDPDITQADIVNMLHTCATIGIVMSIFPILGGILSLRRKLFGVVLTSAIIGIILFIPSIISGILSVVAVILVFISRKEYGPLFVKQENQ
jgi:hypothetical protein